MILLVQLVKKNLIEMGKLFEQYLEKLEQEKNTETSVKI